MITEMTVRVVSETVDSVAYAVTWAKSDGTRGESRPIKFNKMGLQEDDVIFNLGVRWKDLAEA